MCPVSPGDLLLPGMAAYKKYNDREYENKHAVRKSKCLLTVLATGTDSSIQRRFT